MEFNKKYKWIMFMTTFFTQENTHRNLHTKIKPTTKIQIKKKITDVQIKKDN